MKLRDLQCVIEYAIEQAVNGCQILDDTTTMGYASSTYHDKQLTDLYKMQGELNEVRALYDKNDESDHWHDEVAIASWPNICDAMNAALYNVYGELYRANNNNGVAFRSFEDAVRDSIDCMGFEHYTTDMLYSGWQLVSDLFEENEKTQSNDEAGHFNA